MDFTTKDVQEINDYIRFWLGDIDESIISDETMNFIIQMVIDRDLNYTGCDVIYYSTIEILRWLVRKQETGTSAGSGEIKSRKEKVGDIDVETTYDVGINSSGTGGWGSVLDDLLDNPNMIGCTITDTGENNKAGKVIVGGVSHEEYNRVNSNPDVKNGWEFSSPYRCNLNNNKNLIG